MQFNNPIVAGEELAITAIRSQDYIESTSGWRIARDGSAQFANVNVLGDFGATGQISADSFQIGPNGLWLPDDTEVGARLDAIDTEPMIGQVLRGAIMTSSANLHNLSNTVEFPIMELDTGFIPKTGWYGFYISTILMQQAPGAAASTLTPRIRYTSTSDGITTPAAPTITSAFMIFGPYLETDGSALRGGPQVFHRHFNAGERYRLLYCMFGGSAQTYTVYNGQMISWVCIYHGETDDNTTTDSFFGVGVTNSGGTAAPAPKVTYTKTYTATWSRTYDGDNTTTWDDSAYCYQGYYSSDRGNTRSLVGFNYTQIQSDLSGATINSCKLTYKVAHAYYNAGMTVELGGHNYTAKPSTWASGSVTENQVAYASQVAGSTYTKTLPSAFGTNLKSGTWKGVSFGPGPSNSLTYYGYLYGATQTGKPYLTINYTK